MRRRSLSFKLIFGGLLLALVPMAVVGFIAVYNGGNALDEQAKGQAEHLAANMANIVQEYMTEEVKTAEAMAANPLIEAVAQGQAQDVAMVDSWLARAFKNYSQNYEAAMVANAQGKVVADSVGGQQIGMDLSGREYFRQAMENQTVISPPLKSKLSGKPVVVVATPVRGADNKVAGVYLNILITEALSKVVTETRIGKTGYPWMIDSVGLVVAHPDAKHILNTNLAQNEGMKEITSNMLRGEAGVGTYTFQGFEKVCGYAPVPVAGWSVGFTQNTEEFMAPITDMRNLTILLAVIVLLVSSVGIYFFARSISKPVGEAARQLNRGSEQVAAASHQVAAAGQSLAEGTSQQAASLEETSASLEELTSMTKQNAGNAAEADGLMRNVKDMALQATTTMDELLGSMSDINNAGQEINKIIKSIDEIAFQTNLLALNAAVEAARAGEAGAGFAVVADEVRNLAMRAAEAARNTASLITGVNDKIAHGTGLANQMDEAFRDVTNNATKVAELVAEITAASREQSQGITQINEAVGEMDTVTQTIAANAEESAAAAEELSSQAASMTDIAVALNLVVKGGSVDDNAESRAQLVHQAAPIKTLPKARQPKAHRPSAHQATKSLPPKASASKVDPKQAIPFDDERDFVDF